jgi:asparagine synthase (glutamine-hydrolysing)
VSLPWRERYVDELSFLPGFEREMPLLSDDFRASVGNGQNPEQLMLSYLDQKHSFDRLSQLLYLDTKTYLAGDILTKVDRMSMLTSLEVRVPLLDHELVEWAARLAPRWKMRGPQQKYLLRKVAERVGVPHQVLDRPKRGFALPLVHWMRNEMKDLIETVLLEPRTLQRGYFRPSAVRHILDEHFRGRRDQSGAIWRLLIFELWQRNFLERFLQEPALAGSGQVASMPGGTA